MNDELRARVLEAAAAEPAPDRAATRRREFLILAAGVLWALGVFWSAGGARLGPRPDALVLATFAGAVGVALIAFALGYARGGSMLGRRGLVLRWTVFGAPLAYMGWKILWSSTYDGMTEEWPDRPGFRCLGLSLRVGVGVFAAMMLLRRGRVAVRHVEQGAGIGVAAGMITASLVDLWCPVSHPEHLLIGHVLPALLFAAAGALLSRWVLAVRRGKRG
jgi:hypothetical protein